MFRRAHFLAWVLILLLAGCSRPARPGRPSPPPTHPATSTPFPSPPGETQGQPRLVTSDGLSLAFSADGRVQVSLDGRPLAAAPALPFAVREMTEGLAHFLQGEDLLQGAGRFEEAAFPWSGVNIGHQQAPCRAQRSSARAQAGAWSLMTPPDTHSACQSGVIPVEGGRRYRVGGWWLATPYGFPVWRQSAPLVESGMAWYRATKSPPRVNGFFVQWLDAQGNPLPDFAVPRLAVALHTVTPDWTLLQAEVEAPPQARGLRLIIQTMTTTEGDTLWVDEVRVIQSPEEEAWAQPLAVEQPAPDRVRYQARVGDLTLTTTWRVQGESITVEGNIAPAENTTPRALDVTLALPVSLQGGVFFPNLHQVQPIAAQGLYENSVSALHDNWLPVALYPYLGVADANRTWGLALATPPRPQWTRLLYDAAHQRMLGVVHLAISPQATKLGGHAHFSFVLLRFAPDWGLRRLIAKYARLYPGFFASRLDFAHASLPAQEIHPCYDAAQGAWRALDQISQAHREGHLASMYIAASLALDVLRTADHPSRPTYAEIQAAVDDLATPEWPEQPTPPACKRQGSTLQPHPDEIARAVQASAALGPTGEPLLFGVAAPRWWSQGWWQAQWAVNWDPDLPQGHGRWLFHRIVQPVAEATAALGEPLDFLRWDNFFVFSTIDHRPAALQAVDSGLSFEPSYYSVGVPTSFTMAELMDFVYTHYFNDPTNDALPEIYRQRAVGAGANAWAVSALKFIHLDLYGGEGATENEPHSPRFAQAASWNPEILDFRRAMAYQRPLRFSDFAAKVSPEHAARLTALALLYGISVTPNPHVMKDWPEASLCTLMRADNLVAQYEGAGWQPVPYARADAPRVRVERFGESAGQGVFFVVYNDDDRPREATLHLDAAGVGLTSWEGWRLAPLSVDPQRFPLDDEDLARFWQQHCASGNEADRAAPAAVAADGTVALGTLPPHTASVWRLQGPQSAAAPRAKRPTCAAAS